MKTNDCSFFNVSTVEVKQQIGKSQPKTVVLPCKKFAVDCIVRGMKVFTTHTKEKLHTTTNVNKVNDGALLSTLQWKYRGEKNTGNNCTFDS